jgi:hypothetical protein
MRTAKSCVLAPDAGVKFAEVFAGPTWSGNILIRGLTTSSRGLRVRWAPGFPCALLFWANVHANLGRFAAGTRFPRGTCAPEHSCDIAQLMLKRGNCLQLPYRPGKVDEASRQNS